MKPAPFDYLRAASLDDALEALRQHGPEARIIAGGQSLMPMLNMRLTKPAVLVDVMRIPALKEPRLDKGALVIPAGVRQAILLDRPGLARICRCWPPPCRGSGTSRPGRVGRCAAPSPMPTRARKSPSASWRCRARFTCAAAEKSGAWRPRTSSPA